MKTLNGEYGPFDVVQGDFVVCITSEHEEYYYPGEVFAVVKNVHTTLQKQNSSFTYGGHYGTWAMYHGEGVEDLL
jgi:hypothetical protein